MPQSRAPLIVAIVLLLLPVLYVGSYCALVVPGLQYDATIINNGRVVAHYPTASYRAHCRWFEQLFWPLEQIDRKVRPGAWEPAWESAPPLGI